MKANQNNIQMDSIDYSKKTNWYKIPEITKDVDTFYIYSTIFMGANEGAPDYATLDNAEMLEGIKIEHAIKSSVFEESTNLFIPLYRQSSMNLGSLVMDESGATEIRDIDADAQVNIARGTVVTNAKAIPNEMTELAGPQCYHQDDYSIFFSNIKDNVAKRIAAYKASR